MGGGSEKKYKRISRQLTFKLIISYTRQTKYDPTAAAKTYSSSSEEGKKIYIYLKGRADNNMDRLLRRRNKNNSDKA